MQSRYPSQITHGAHSADRQLGSSHTQSITRVGVVKLDVVYLSTHRSARRDVAANTPLQLCCSRSHHSSGRCSTLICTANGINNHDSLVLAPLVTAAVIYWILIRDAAASAPPPTCISSEPRRKVTSDISASPCCRSCATISIAKPCQALRSRNLTGPRGTYLSTLILSHPISHSLVLRDLA